VYKADLLGFFLWDDGVIIAQVAPDHGCPAGDAGAVEIIQFMQSHIHDHYTAVRVNGEAMMLDLDGNLVPEHSEAAAAAVAKPVEIKKIDVPKIDFGVAVSDKS
jgi:hypothetical protein